MSTKSPKVQIQFINQALSQATANLAQAKSLMHELEESLSSVLPSSRDLPGIIGKFDGTYLVTDDGKKFQVPENYASKSKLVFGDTLKMIEDVSGGMATFKQIERVARATLTGVLVKKDGKFVAVTSDGSHSLIAAAVSFHHGVEGDEVKVIVPEDGRNCAFAALDEIPSRDTAVKTVEPPHGAALPVLEPLPSKLVQDIVVKPTKEDKPKPVEKPIKKAPVKEQVSSISETPATPVKPAPKVAPVMPKTLPQTSSIASLASPSGAPVNSILADDDLR